MEPDIEEDRSTGRGRRDRLGGRCRGRLCVGHRRSAWTTPGSVPAFVTCGQLDAGELLSSPNRKEFHHAYALQAAGGRRLRGIRGSFDEFNLDIELLYDGPPLVLNAEQAAAQADLLDMDDESFQAALEHALSGVSHVLLKRLADRLTSGQRGDQSYIRLHFDH